MSINLKPFLAGKHHFRPALQSPFRLDRWVYATNGHIAVRVAAISMPEVPERSAKQPNNIGDLFSRTLETGSGELVLLPPLPPLVQCELCGGSGEYTYDHEDGAEECPKCMGTGYEWGRVAMGDTGYALHYMHLLSALPQVRIRPQGPTNAAAVIFDGGQAILMPMREK